MGKGHRDNVAARKKAVQRGQNPYKKREKRRRDKYVGSWFVDFQCGNSVVVPLAGSADVEAIARRVQHCKNDACVPIKYRKKED